MAGSSGNLLDPYFVALLNGIPDLKTALDIGPGQGKYGQLLMKHAPACHREGIEVYAEYVKRFGLDRWYHKMTIGNAVQLMNEHTAQWDLVILGDVLEHMPKSVGTNLLHFLVYRARYLWIQWPIRYVQGPEDGNVFESHISVWNEADIIGLNTTYKRFQDVPLEAYAVNGYLNVGRQAQEMFD